MIRLTTLAKITIPALLVLPLAALSTTPALKPDRETHPSPYQGDSADDAAVWLHPEDPGQSVILTTIKASNVKPVLPTGIMTLDLEGRLLEFFEDGTPNNIDTRFRFPFPDGLHQIIGASHWYTGELAFYRMNPETRALQQISKTLTTVRQLRGFCFGLLSDGHHAFAVGSSGDVEQYRIHPNGQATLVKQWSLNSESEGCVVDDDKAMLYVSEENYGIWQIDLTDADATPLVLDRIRWFGPLKRGLEGLSLIDVEGDTYLVVSVQEKSRFAIYDLQSRRHLGNFVVGGTGQIDPVSKTDGIHIEQTSTPQYPNGFMVVHDDVNEDMASQNQNFKVVPLGSLIELIEQLRKTE